MSAFAFAVSDNFLSAIIDGPCYFGIITFGKSGGSNKMYRIILTVDGVCRLM